MLWRATAQFLCSKSNKMPYTALIDILIWAVLSDFTVKFGPEMTFGMLIFNVCATEN